MVQGQPPGRAPREDVTSESRVAEVVMKEAERAVAGLYRGKDG
jgi:hypothetical protein